MSAPDLAARLSPAELGQRYRAARSPVERSHLQIVWLLFYRPIRDGIELVRVLHGMRDVDAILKSEPGPEREGE